MWYSLYMISKKEINKILERMDYWVRVYFELYIEFLGPLINNQINDIKTCLKIFDVFNNIFLFINFLSVLNFQFCISFQL